MAQLRSLCQPEDTGEGHEAGVLSAQLSWGGSVRPGQHPKGLLCSLRAELTRRPETATGDSTC